MELNEQRIKELEEVPLPEPYKQRWKDMWREVRQFKSMNIEGERQKKLARERIKEWEIIYNEAANILSIDEAVFEVSGELDNFVIDIKTESEQNS